MGPKYLVDYGSLRMVISLRPYLGYVGSPQIRMGALGAIRKKTWKMKKVVLGMNGLYMIFTYYIIASAKLLGHGQGHPSDQQKSKSIYTY